MKNFIKQEITKISLGKIKEIKDTDRIVADLGLDSLDYAQIMLACEERSKKRVNEDAVNWREIDTVEKLAALF